MAKKKYRVEPKVDPKRVAEALGAVPVGARSSKPLDIIDVRERLQKQANEGPWLDEPLIEEERAQVIAGENDEPVDW